MRASHRATRCVPVNGTAETLPDAVAVMDPFHVVALAGDAVDRCRQRVQQHLHGHRGRSGDPATASAASSAAAWHC